MTTIDAYHQLVTTDVFDSPDAKIREQVQPAELETFPYRDPDRLRAAWADHGTVTGVADALDCSQETASRWLAAYGIREPTDSQDLHNWLRSDDVGPEDVGLPAGPGGESA